jgi:uncharacterized glyoxalase superfamily protein PhnB
MTTDPFESLREPLAPIAPRAEFAAELRRLLAHRLGLADDGEHTLAIREYTPARLHSLTPYLSCKGADEAIAWYQDVFDAVLLDDPIIMDDGHVGHAELRVGDTTFMVADEYAAEQVYGPDTLGGNSVALMLYVPDSDATFARAVGRGAAPVRPVSAAYGARQGVIRDPFGHRWFVCTHIEPEDIPTEDVFGRRYGDVGYVTLAVPDGARARRFYGALFHWQFEAGHESDSFHISSVTPPAGILGGGSGPDVRLYFRVDDIDTAVARVRELGGEVLSITEYDSGGNAECRDDQGLRFDLFRPRAGY